MHEVLGFEQLLADVGAVVGRVGGVVGHAAIVVDESHEAGVFHALGLGTHRRQEHLLAQRRAVLESDAVAPLGDPAHEADGPLRLLPSGHVVLEESEPCLHLRFGEPRSEVTQDVVGVIAASTEPTELSFEDLGLEHRRVPSSLGGKGRSGIEVDVARTRDRPRPEADGGAVALADGPDTHDEPQRRRG